jgi:hypothetical protein
MVIADDLYKTIGNFDVCTKFEFLEAKVPIIFLGTEGFLRRRDRRYTGIYLESAIWRVVRALIENSYAEELCYVS